MFQRLLAGQSAGTGRRAPVRGRLGRPEGDDGLRDRCAGNTLGRLRAAGGPGARRWRGALPAAKKSLEHTPEERLRWRVLKTFGALPTELK